ncbi:gem-associated protein 8-like [Plakobranchus ocellatus]|uniref:Gem-associated protein 8-like n=1 Tax=Plakobranchus ocellatus TaxID=259542 RepID=A0AAV3XVI7_9GAST|nr:gem-associated protein 8-like [Plakobranchus ocellatus]
MAEKGHTSSITSVTEYDSSVGSESDTTESSLSNLTSSVLSSTDTDDKVTPLIGGISILAAAHDKNRTYQNGGHALLLSGTEKMQQCERDCVSQMTMKMKHYLKDRHLHNYDLHCPLSRPNAHHSANCDDNMGMTDKENKLSTDFSDTSSIAVAEDKAIGCLNAPKEEKLVRKGKINDVRDLGKKNSSESPADVQSWEPDMSSSTWYTAQCFDRYWCHYRFVMAWYQAHMDAVQKLHRDMSTWWCKGDSWIRESHGNNNIGSHVGQHVSPHSRGQGNNSVRHNQRARRAGSRRLANARQRAASRTSANCMNGVNRTNSSVLGDEGSLRNRSVHRGRPSVAGERKPEKQEEDGKEEMEMEMEITEEMMDFFKTSLKHRMERDLAKNGASREDGSPEIRMNIEDAISGQAAPTSAPPQERPGARRAQEMKQLYGAGAPMIHGMETALQMTFDRIQDKFQPKLWPNMPLKIIFG